MYNISFHSFHEKDHMTRSKCSDVLLWSLCRQAFCMWVTWDSMLTMLCHCRWSESEQRRWSATLASTQLPRLRFITSSLLYLVDLVDLPSIYSTSCHAPMLVMTACNVSPLCLTHQLVAKALVHDQVPRPSAIRYKPLRGWYDIG